MPIIVVWLSILIIVGGGGTVLVGGITAIDAIEGDQHATSDKCKVSNEEFESTKTRPVQEEPEPVLLKYPERQPEGFGSNFYILLLLNIFFYSLFVAQVSRDIRKS